MTIDISSLITLGDGMRLGTSNPARPTYATVLSTLGESVMDDVVSLARSRSVNSRGRHYLKPSDFGALGIVANPGVDEQDYISWCLRLGVYAAQRAGSSVPYSCYLGEMSGGYLTGGAMEVDSNQQMYGDFEMTVVDAGTGNMWDDTLTKSGGPTLTYKLDELFEVIKGGGSTNYTGADDSFPFIGHVPYLVDSGPPTAAGMPGAENPIIENIEIDGGIVTGGWLQDGKLTYKFSDDVAYDSNALNTLFRDTPVGAAMCFSNTNWRSLIRNITLNQLYIHDQLSQGINGNKEYNNIGNGILVFENSACQRGVYECGMKNVSRIYISGHNGYSDQRGRWGKVGLLHISPSGPFGTGTTTTTRWPEQPQGGEDTNGYVISMESVFNGSPDEENVMELDELYVDGNYPGWNQGSQGINSDGGVIIRKGYVSEFSGRLIGGSLNNVIPRQWTGGPLRKTIWDITCTLHNCDGRLFSVPGHVFRGDLDLTYTYDEGQEPASGSVNPITVAVLRNDSAQTKRIINITIDGPDVATTWVAVLSTLYDSDDNPRDFVADIVPTQVNMRVNIDNNQPYMFNTAVNGGLYPTGNELKYCPVKVRLEHPASGITWLEGGSAEDQSVLFYRWDYETDPTPPSYRRVYIVADADKATANSNMQDAGLGSNCFNLALTKLGSDYWAACLVASDFDKNWWEEPVSAGVAVFHELTVSGTGPSGFRDAIDAAGYAFA